MFQRKEIQKDPGPKALKSSDKICVQTKFKKNLKFHEKIHVNLRILLIIINFKDAHDGKVQPQPKICMGMNVKKVAFCQGVGIKSNKKLKKGNKNFQFFL